MSRALTDDLLAEMEAEILARPVRPGNFRCAGCRYQYPNEDRHILFHLCDGCGDNEIHELLLDLRGRDTRDNRRAALAALALLAEEMIESRRESRRLKRRAV
jgi:hypothetical protein